MKARSPSHGPFLTLFLCPPNLPKIGFSQKGNCLFYNRNCSTICICFWRLLGRPKNGKKRKRRWKKEEKRKTNYKKKGKMEKKGKKKKKRKSFKIESVRGCGKGWGKGKKNEGTWKMKKSKRKKEKEKMKKKKPKWRKILKYGEISEDFSCFWLHTQNPQRFPGFTDVVVTFFEFLDDLHDCFGKCLFPDENQQPILGLAVFQGKAIIFIGRETRTHILPTKLNDFLIRSAPLK